MTELIAKFKDYLQDMLGMTVHAMPNGLGEALPAYLAQRYIPQRVDIGGHPYMAVLVREGETIKPATVQKHLKQVSLGGAEGYCLVAHELPSFVRKRLIKRKIPFVVPGNQVYLPALGMALHPRSRRQALDRVDQLSPPAQVVVILALLGRLPAAVTPLELAQLTGYSAMTMTRALNDLKGLNLGEQQRKGKQRLLRFPGGRRALWETSQGLMRNPVQKTLSLLLADVPKGLKTVAGESALAEWTDLLPPGEPMYAFSRDDWKELKTAGIKPVPVNDVDTCAIQVWCYPPALTAQQGRVDRFSLYLSLREESDERVQMALDEMMGDMEW